MKARAAQTGLIFTLLSPGGIAVSLRVFPNELWLEA